MLLPINFASRYTASWTISDNTDRLATGKIRPSTRLQPAFRSESRYYYDSISSAPELRGRNAAVLFPI
ncbi:hypothetical protein CI238_00390 [Colletotrichum incanum]|uniref:Uncharacterized protein n=1 Tax=Colletotrichum incanum TaxID=1573173 RepID=A0A161WB28_COLIC|nr:hypothetical protein CI238_00390 [Colletotrichum incanum]